MASTLATHDSIVHAVVDAHQGNVFAGGGDGFGLVFDNPDDAIRAAVQIENEIAEVRVGHAPLAVRIGIHTGMAQQRNGDFFGLAVSRTARVAAAANGGQILATDTVAALTSATDLEPLGSFRLPDLLEPVTLYQVGSDRFPPLRALHPERHNLPVRFTSLVGRQELITEVVVALETHRLITLVGPGGIGKTSVGTAVAAEMATRNQYGAWLVALDQIATDADVLSAIASSIRLDPTEGWRRTAAARDQLVFIDNAEHLLDPVATAVVSLLHAGPNIRVLVTSREPLGVPGEHVIDVTPLESGGAGLDLFRDRAPAAGFSDDELQPLVELTDGMPLAIELVAARASRISLADLETSLRQHGVGSLIARGVTSRHASVHAAVNWSYALLTDPEQRAFEALSVFSGTFSLEDAATVSETSPGVIQALVEKSLVHAAGDRYRLLEPIREFAALRSSERGSTDRLVSRLAERVAELVDDAAARLPARPPDTWEGQLAISFRDIHRAFEHAVTEGDIPLLLRLYQVIPGPILRDREHMTDVLKTLEPALPALEERLPETRWALYRHAFCEDKVDREPDALARARRLRTVGEDVDDLHLVAACDVLTLSALVGDRSMSLEDYAALAEQAAGYPGTSEWWEPSALAWLQASHALSLGEFESAELHSREALRLGMAGPYNLLLATRILVNALTAQTRHDEARRLLDDLPADVADRFPGMLTSERAHLAIAMGDSDSARRDIQRIIEEEKQPTTEAFCPAADYCREVDDHRAAVWFLSKMLGGGPPGHPIHHRVIDSARAALGSDFDSEWRRGESMDLLALHGLIREL